MKITWELRLDKKTKAGFVPIRMVVCWDGHRLRESTGLSVRPEHWDGSYVLSKPGSFNTVINPKLAGLRQVAEDAEHAAGREHRRLLMDELAGLLQAYLKPPPLEPAPAAVQEAAKPRRAKLGLFDEGGLYDEWVAEQRAKSNQHSGKATSINTIKAYKSTQQRFRAFEEHRGKPLKLEEMDLLRFYEPFREYVRNTMDRKLNTFGKYISHLNTFLTWCEDDRDLPVHRQSHKFVAPSRYVGVEALTEDELVRIATLDFTGTLREKIYSLWPAPTSRKKDLYKLDLTISGPRFAEYAYQVELARDKFLQCCYTGLSIQDADTVGPGDVHGDIIRWDRGKSGNSCHIPYYDDTLFKPVALAAKYAGQSEQLVPRCPKVNAYLKLIAQLAGVTRVGVSTKIGRKTFVTLKLFQGVPSRMVMMATGHTTEASFNHYVGVDVLALVNQYKKHGPNRAA
ncbi:phage integrase SAM-like domain-containing protein [Hymenobacter algoricola]|uniref:Site-specific integrase n=1 Tax=Hymenobacter algoricola TaxID=486267 RepID=A0ABP7NUL1_9BACT